MTHEGADGRGEYHIPVMRDEVAWLLRPRRGGTYVDCTVGGGGHAGTLLELSGPGTRLVGIDRDPDAIEAARHALACFGDAAILVCENFVNLERVTKTLGIEGADGVVFDLGASSRQFDEPGRGFSYMEEGPLDMRMDGSSGPSAQDLINTLPAQEIARILRDYGEERWAFRIAGFIDKRRRFRPLRTTGELVDIVKDAIPARARRSGPHPARRTFQALRIAVNRELENLTMGLDQATRALCPGGRLVVISYHSLEDRIVKEKLAEVSAKREGRLRVLTTKPLVPCEDEVKWNPRSRSAKLRAAEKF